MRLYLDTSLIVSALSREPRSPAVLAWLEARSGDELLISDWVVTELSAALSMKVRAGIFSRANQEAALAMFATMQARLFGRVPFAYRFFRRAAGLANAPGAGLRAGDALHLAICAEAAERLCTLDNAQAQAARQMGLDSLVI